MAKLKRRVRWSLVGTTAVAGGSAPSFLTVFPAGATLPNASNINWKDGTPIANQMTATIGSDRSIDIFNSIGRVDVIIDLAGYHLPASTTGAPGPVGPKGDQGAAGSQGATGPTGPSGSNGAPGPQGIAGPTGATGPIGLTGAQGATGAVGTAGSTGVAILGRATLGATVISLPDGGATWPFPSAASAALDLGPASAPNGYYLASMSTVRNIDQHEPVTCWLSDGTTVNGGMFSGTTPSVYLVEPDHQELLRESVPATIIHITTGTIQVRCARQDDNDPLTGPLLTDAELNLIPIASVVSPSHL